MSPPRPAEGVFETLRVHRGRALELDLHQARLQRSFRALFGVDAPDLSALLELEPDSEGLLRLAFGSAGPQDWSRILRPRVPVRTPFRVALAEQARVGEPSDWSHKRLDRRWVEAARVDGAEETLVWTVQGGVLEGLRSNVFLAKGLCLRTPPMSAGLVPGVVRARILEDAARFGLKAEEGRLDPAELGRDGAILLSGSGLGLVRAAGLDGRPGFALAPEAGLRLRRLLESVRGGADQGVCGL